MHSGSMLRGQGAQWVNSERSGLHSGSEAQFRIELRLSTWGGSNSCVRVGGATMWSSGHSVKLCYIIIPDKGLSVSFSSSLTHFSSLTNLVTSVAQTGEDSVTLAASVHSCVCACVSVSGSEQDTEVSTSGDRCLFPLPLSLWWFVCAGIYKALSFPEARGWS